MEQTQRNDVAVTEQLNFKAVDFFIDAQLISVTGNWEWDMHSEAVYCSDVIMGMPPDYVGTKGIIHPDDIEDLKQQLLSFKENEVIDIDFRLITTYNEVKSISGKNCSKVQVNELKLQPPVKEFLASTSIQREFEKGYENFHTVKDTVDFAEKLTRTATWFTNTDTNETYYSDNVFRMHAITPQSLNPHLNTFSHFIHPDDANAVNDAFDAGYKNAVPIFIEYRIITANGNEKFISLTTNWSHNFKGQLILNGLLQDLTITRENEQKIEQAENDVQFQKALLQFNEQAGSTGYWQMNLLTRQTFYSDNYYRLHGVKPQSIPAAANIFTNYIHPDDREKVIEAFKKIRKEHVAPDLEYSILRADGKVRYVVQKGQLMSYGDELVMTGTIRDITSQKIAEQKLNEQNEIALLKETAYLETEQAAGISSWVHDIKTGSYLWSENMYSFLGFKKSVKELTFAQLLKSVLPEDRKSFTDEIAMATENGERSLEFGILRNGEVRKVKGVFKVVNTNDKKVFTGTLQDVTSKRLLEEQLFEGSQLNQLLVQNIVDSVFITDINNRIILWNRKCEQVFNLKMDEVIDRNYFDVFADKKTETVINRFNNVLKGDIIHEPHERLFAKEFHDLNMLPLRDKENKVIAILHVLHDVTREVQLRNSLSDRLNFIERVVEETVDRIIVLDRNLNFVFWNKKAENYFRINKEYAIGKNLLQVFPNMVTKSFYIKIREALKGQEIYVPADPTEEQIFETYLIPVKNEKDNVAEVLWLSHDLTNEISSKKNQKKAENILGAIDQGCYELDKNENYIYVNQKAEEIWGIKGGNLIGKNVWEVFPEAVDTFIYFSIKDAIEKKIATRGEYISPITKRWTSLGVTPTEDGVIVLFYDIDEQKKAEQQILNLKDRIAQQTTDKYLTLFNSIDEGFYLAEVQVDKKNKPVDIYYHEENPAAVRLLGVSVKGKKLTEVSQSYEPYWFNAFGSVALTGESKRLEQYSRVDHKWFNFYVSKMGDESSRNIAIVFQDITERKLREANSDFITEIIGDISRLSSPDEIIQVAGAKIGAYMKVDNCSFVDIEETAEKEMIPIYNWFSSGERSYPGAFRIRDYLTEEFEKASRAGETIVVSDTNTDSRTDAKGYDALKVNAFITVPFLRSGQWKYFLACSTERPREWRQDEIKLFEEFGNLIFPRLEKARAEEQLRNFNALLERQVAERTNDLQESKDLLQAVFDLSPSSITVTKIIYDKHGGIDDLEILALNDFTARRTGLKTEHAVGKHFGKLFPHSKKIGLFQKLAEVARTGEPIETEFFYEGEGMHHWFYSYVRKVGELLIITSEDITERKKAEQLIKESSNFISRVNDTTPDILYLMDINTRQVTYTNRQVEQVLGYAEKEIKKMKEPFFDLMHPDDKERMFHHIEEMKTAADAEIREIEYRMKHADNRWRWFIDRNSVFQRDASGIPSIKIGISRDITENKIAEEELVKNREEILKNEIAYKANLLLHKKKDEFISIASHELKSPVTSLKMSLHLLGELLSKNEENKKLHQFIKKTDKQADKLTDLVDDLMDITRINEGKLNIRRSKFNLQEAIAESMEALFAQMKDCKIRMEGNTELEVYADKVRIQQVITNYLTNAVKYSPAEKDVTIRIEQQDELVKVCVTDKGIGIPEDNLDKVFDRYFRVDENAQQYAGLGLGLYISKEIIKKHGGEVGVISSKGSGSTFWFSLPVKK